MEITARDTSGPIGGFIAVKLDDTTYARYPTHISFEVDGLPWRVEGIVYTDTSKGPDDMVPEVIKLTVASRPDGPRIKPDMIRGLKLGEIRDEAVRLVSQPMRVEGTTLWSVPESEGTADPRVVKVARSQRGRRVTDDDLAEAVDAYRAIVSDGRTDRTIAVAERLNLSSATAGRRIHLARKRGLLAEGE